MKLRNGIGYDTKEFPQKAIDYINSNWDEFSNKYDENVLWIITKDNKMLQFVPYYTSETHWEETYYYFDNWFSYYGEDYDLEEEDIKNFIISSEEPDLNENKQYKKIMNKNSRSQYQRMQELAGITPSYIIKENEEEQPEGGVSAMRATYSTVLKPKNASIEDVDNALNDIENYGTFKTQSIRNASLNKAEINKAIEDHFGPSIPSKKKAALKARGGEPFPIRTKQSLDDFMKQFTGKPKLLSWEVQGDSIIFKQGKNPQKKMLEDVISTVMDNAGIKYELTKKEEI